MSFSQGPKWKALISTYIGTIPISGVPGPDEQSLSIGLPSRHAAGYKLANDGVDTRALQPHRSSPTHRPTDHKNATHLSATAIATTHPTAPPTSTVARPQPNPHS